MNKQSGLVSIIIPVYNCSNYIERCLESIQKQSYTNFEVLLVDDGSTDNGGISIENFSLADTRFTIYHIPNRGAAGARNFALEMINGEYITFIDADDYVESDYLEKLIQAIESASVDISQCFWRRPNTVYKELMSKPENFTQRIFDRHHAMKDIVTENVLCTSVWGKLYRRNLFIDIRFPNMKTGEDSSLLIDIYALTQEIISIPYIGYIYYWNSNGLDATRKNDLSSVVTGEKMLFYAQNCDPELIGVSLTKYAVFLQDAIWDAVALQDINTIRSLSSRIKKIDLSQCRLHWKTKLSLYLFEISPWVSYKVLQLLNAR